MRTSFKVYELKRKNTSAIWLQPFELVEPAGYLGAIHYPDEEKATKDIEQYGLPNTEYTVLKAIERD